MYFVIPTFPSPVIWSLSNQTYSSLSFFSLFFWYSTSHNNNSSIFQQSYQQAHETDLTVTKLPTCMIFPIATELDIQFQFQYQLHPKLQMLIIFLNVDPMRKPQTAQTYTVDHNVANWGEATAAERWVVYLSYPSLVLSVYASWDDHVSLCFRLYVQTQPLDVFAKKVI